MAKEIEEINWCKNKVWKMESNMKREENTTDTHLQLEQINEGL